jgi:hypothetical protein
MREDVEGNDRGRIKGIVQEFVWRKWGRPWQEWYSVSTENRTSCHSNTSRKRTVVASFLGVLITEVCLQNFPCLSSRLVWQLHPSVAVLGRTIRFPPGLWLLWPLLVFYAVFYQRTRVGWGTALKAGRSWVRFPVVSLELFFDIILPTPLWLGGRLSL